MAEAAREKIYLFYTGSEAEKSRVPFLLDAEMRPITAVNAWLRDIAQSGATSSFHTRRAYAYDLFDFLSYLQIRKITWHQITNDTVAHYRDIQDQNPSPHTKKPLSRRTINARLLTVGRFYVYAFEEGFIDKNPLKYKELKFHRPADDDLLAHIGTGQTLKVPSVIYERLAKPKIKWRSHSEVMTWLNSIDVWRDKLIGKLLYRTGMRRDEVASLTIPELPSRSSADPSKLEISFEIIGKGRKKREVILATRDFIELHDYILTERALCVRKAKKKHTIIFVTRTGDPLPPAYINRIFKYVSERCGIKITPHMLRHSFAVAALQHWKAIGHSQPEKLLQARLGHARITTTRIYMHLTDEMKVKEAHANASLIDMLMEGEIDETK
jgi:site-specific recombinase XerD